MDSEISLHIFLLTYFNYYEIYIIDLDCFGKRKLMICVLHFFL